MSIENARTWLLQHSHLVPALTINQQEITRLLKNHRHADQVVRVAIRDPGLSLALLIKVNSQRGPDSGKDIVESPLAAISLLGDQVCHTLFQEFPLAEQTLGQPHQLFLFQQLINRSLHNEIQAESWATEMGFKTLEQIKVAALVAYAGEVLCCTHDFDRYFRYVQAGSGEAQAEKLFGFQFPELTEVLCRTLNLPEAILQSLPQQLHDGQSSKLLFHTRQISRFCEFGWYGDAMRNALEQMAEWLQMPLERVVQKTHAHAIRAADASFVPDAWQPAARLVLIRDAVWGPHLRSADRQSPPRVAQAPNQRVASRTKDQPAPVTESSVVEAASDSSGVMDTIKALVRKPQTTQSELLTVSLRGMLRDLRLSRVSLLLLSKDRSTLQNRLSQGLATDSPLRNLTIPLDQAGLLRNLLAKPQALWINRDTIGKYQAHLPQNLLATVMTDRFVAMSLFIGNKPIGIVYADRVDHAHGIDAALYSEFKQLVTLTSKALTLLAKR